MQQNQRGRNNRRRKAYDQARDPARRTTAQPGGDRRGTPGSGRSGHPITNPNYDPDAPRPSRYTERQVSMGGYADNSIQFPAGGRVQTGTRPRPADAQRRPQGRSAARRPAGGPNRRSSAPPRNRRAQSGQRLRPTQANLRDPARREGRKKRRLTRAAIRRRRMFRRLTALAMLAAVIAAGVYLTVTMLFKISAIQVRTADGIVQEVGGYSSDQIVQTLGVNLEENIFSFDPTAKAAALEKVFPMLEDIRVERDYPSTVVVRVAEAQPAYAMQTAKGWLTLSAGLKILAADSAQPTGLPTLYGGEPVFSDPGEQLCFEEETPANSTASESASDAADSASAAVEEEAGDKRLEALSTLLTALDTVGMRGDVTRIEFADPEEMAFLYQDRISVRLGTLNELDYKLKLARHVLLNEDGKGCAATDTGTLDFTHISMSSTRKFTFAQGEPELPSGYVVPEPTTPEEAPAEEAADSTAEGAADAAPPADAAAQPADDAQAPTTETDPAPAAQDTAGTGAAN